MSKSSNIIFMGVHIIAWLIFVGLCIEAGGLIVNFCFSLFKPEFVQNLYQKLDLSELYSDSRLTYFFVYGLILSIAILKAWLFYIVVNLMHKLDLSKPFNTFVARQITLMSYFTVIIGLLSYMSSEVAENLLYTLSGVDNLTQFWEGGEAFILMGAVIYIIATIFTKGVDIQNEIDLTV